MDSTADAVVGMDPTLVLEQLRRLLDSKEFDASERNRRFLRYVVEETLAGRSERIKAYNIATTVFDRDEGFDPQSDPIVRIEAKVGAHNTTRALLFADLRKSGWKHNAIKAALDSAVDANYVEAR